MKPDWIKCSDRLPTDKEYIVDFVLKGREDRKIHKGYYDDVYGIFESETLALSIKCVSEDEVSKWREREDKITKNKSYYRVFVSTSKNAGVHIIKAFSKEDALRIRKKFGISNPWGRKRIKYINCKRMDMRNSLNKGVIKRRKKGQGGSVWYEDEYERLQQETE